MAFDISFPNFLCLLLTGFLIVHLLTNDSTLGSKPIALENLETVFCKLPQSFWLEKSSIKTCSSTSKLFILLTNDCSYQRILTLKYKNKPLRINDTKSYKDKFLSQKKITNYNTNLGAQESEFEERIVNDDTLHSPLEEITKNQKDLLELTDLLKKEENEAEDGNSFDHVTEQTEEIVQEDGFSLKIFDCIIIGLLVSSAAFSLLELYREKVKINENVPQGENGGSGEGENSSANRRISLADLTVNRHLRRRDSQQQLETIRQTTTNTPGARPPPLIRRSSFPAQFPEVPQRRHAPRRQTSTPGLPLGRRMSIDLSEDDSSPDRRRVRIIRRH